MKTPPAILLVSLAVAFSLALSAPSQAAQENEGDSPSGKIHFAVKGAEQAKHIYLSPAGHPENAVDLCETPGWGNLKMHFSPDDFWIIVEDGGSSLGVSLRLFRRDKGVSYTELKDANIDGKAEQLALQRHGLPATEILDHRYASVLDWSADSTTILVRVSGHGGNDQFHVRIVSWAGIYDLGSGQFSFDLTKFNRASVQKEAK